MRLRFVVFTQTDGTKVNIAAHNITAITEGADVNHPDFPSIRGDLSLAPKCVIIYTNNNYFRVKGTVQEILETLHNV